MSDELNQQVIPDAMQPPTEPAASVAPAPEYIPGMTAPMEDWRPPTKPEWEEIQARKAQAEEALQKAYALLVAKTENAVAPQQPQPAAPDHAALWGDTAEDDRKLIRTGVAAVLAELGLPPDTLKSAIAKTGQLEHHTMRNIYESERRDVEARYGAEQVRKLHPKIEALIKERGQQGLALSYEDATSIVLTRERQTAAAATAASEAAARASVAQRQAAPPSALGNLARPPAAQEPKKPDFTVLPPEKRGDVRSIVDVMLNSGGIYAATP